jgi:hypothetical protein
MAREARKQEGKSSKKQKKHFLTFPLSCPLAVLPKRKAGG